MLLIVCFVLLNLINLSDLSFGCVRPYIADILFTSFYILLSYLFHMKLIAVSMKRKVGE
jgi:hypothetical protein